MSDDQLPPLGLNQEPEMLAEEDDSPESDPELLSDTEDDDSDLQKANFPPRMKNFISVAVESFHGKLFDRVFKLLLRKSLYFNGQAEREEAPYEFRDPASLQRIMNFSVGREGVDDETLIHYLEQVIQFSPHNAHPFKLTCQATGLDPYGIGADWVATTMTACILTYLYAPVFTLMEMAVLRRIRQLVGYSNAVGGDGIVSSDSGHATCMAICLALRQKFPDIREKGFAGIGFPKAVLFVRDGSDLPLYRKYGMYCGIGAHGVIAVQIDRRDKLEMHKLEEAIEAALKAGQVPFMAIGALGSRSYGSIDDFEGMAKICEKYKLWFHVAAHHGAGAWVLSDARRSQIKGIERSDSFTWSQHDLLAVPACSTTLVTNRVHGEFLRCFGLGAKLVFEETYLYDAKFDTGDYTNQTTRRANILKFWLLWKAKGLQELAAHVEKVVENVRFFSKQLNLRRRNFVLLKREPDSNLVPFYYSPTRFLNQLRGNSKAKQTKMLNMFTDRLRNELLKKGLLHLDVVMEPNLPHFFSVALNNSALTKSDMLYTLDQIEYHGQKLEKSTEISEIVDEITGSANDDPDTDLADTVLVVTSSDDEKGEDSTDLEDDDDPTKDSALRGAPTVPVHSADHKFPSYVNVPIRKLHHEFFENVIALIKQKGLYFQPKRREPALVFERPEVLLGLIPLNLDNETGSSEDELLKLLDKVIHYSAHQAHPHFIFQLKAGLDPYGLMADYVVATTTSQSMAYIDSPVYTLMEREVLKAICLRVGFPADGDGIITTGGSAANIFATYVAQYKKFPGIRKTGVTGKFNKRLYMYMSESGHYSPIKGSMFHGTGYRDVILVKSDDQDRMIPSELRAAILDTLVKGGTPFLVIATMGTTALGAIDPIVEIADICQEYSLWLHADGAYGGPVIFSDKHKKKLHGIHLADSFSMNAHKMLNVPTTCTTIVFKASGIVAESLNPYPHGSNPYSPPVTALYNQIEYDVDMRRHYESERRPEVLKLWLQWKAKGRQGMGKHINYCFSLAHYCIRLLKDRSDRFEPILASHELTSVCFYYIPKALRGLTDRKSPAFLQRISKVAFILQARIIQSGKFVFVVGSDDKRSKYLKFIFISSGTTKDDIVYFLDQLEVNGHDIDA